MYGSRAFGNTDKGSDIDLIVVLDERGYSKSFSERLNKSFGIYKSLREIKEKYAFDILVYTLDEWEKLKKINSSFIRQIMREGIDLL